jgi:hypothetical protein
MRPFWRSFWASILAYVVLSALAIFIINILVIAVGSTLVKKEEIVIKENSFLEMKLDFKISERGGVVTTNNLSNPFSKSFGIHDMKLALNKAKKQ